MRVYAVSIRWNNKLKVKQPLLIRLIDLDDNCRVIDVTRKQLVDAIKRNRITINNLMIDKYNKLKGKNYSLSTIPDMDSDNDKHSALVIEKINDLFILADRLGNTLEVDSLNTIKLQNIKIKNIKQFIDLHTDTNTECALEDVDDKELDIRQQSKFKLLLKDSKYDWMLKDSYMKHINIWFKLMKHLERDTDTKLKLNTSNYYYINNELKATINRLNLENRFISLSNLFTALLKNCDYMFNIEFQRKLIVNSDILLYSNENCEIHYREYRSTVELSNNTIYFKTICITINSHRVFEAVYSESKQFKGVSGGNLKTIGSDGTSKKTESTITRYLRPSDVIVAWTIISKLQAVDGLEIPFELVAKIRDSIVDNWRIVSTILEGRTHTIKNMLLYDLAEQLLIDTENINAKAATEPKLVIKNIVPLSEIYKLNRKYIENFNGSTSSKEITNFMKESIMTDEEKERLRHDINNYDLDGNKELCNIADRVYMDAKDNITDDTKGGYSFLLTEKTMNMVLESGFLSKTASMRGKDLIKRYSYCDGGIYKTRKSHSKENNSLTYGAEVLELYTLMANDIGTSQTQIILNKLNNKVYISEMKLKSIISIFYILGERRDKALKVGSIKDYNYVTGITDVPININKLLITDTIKLRANQYKAHVAINRLNCDVYIIFEEWDTTFKTFLRFKRYKDAKDFLFTELRKWNNQGFTELQFDLSNKDYSSFSSAMKEIYEVRDNIMKGIPNNYPYTGKQMDLYEKLAKQPET